MFAEYEISPWTQIFEGSVSWSSKPLEGDKDFPFAVDTGL